MNQQNKLNIIIIAIGDELMADHVDTNGPAMTNLLNDQGFTVESRLILPDDLARLTTTLKKLYRTNNIIICCGGLGPTQDDVTRHAIGAAVKSKLIMDQPSLNKIHQRFELRNLSMPKITEQQALIPQGAQVLLNLKGTAPGFLIGQKQQWIAALPGPPRECLTMLEKQLIPKLNKLFKRYRPISFTRSIRVAGQSESMLQEMIRPLVEPHQRVGLGFLISGPGDILIKLTINDKQDQSSLEQLKICVNQIKARLGAYVIDQYGKSIEVVLGKLLVNKKQTLAIAESCTGGLICSRLTSIAGSSRYINEAVVTYSNQSKIKRLGVSQALLKRCGAVSQEVALAMAQGVRQSSKAQWGLAITGIAGPGGGSPQKPVGLIYIAVVGPQRSYHGCRKLQWSDERTVVQQLAATIALDTLRRAILKLPISELSK